jgi:hypothetical protein
MEAEAKMMWGHKPRNVGASSGWEKPEQGCPREAPEGTNQPCRHLDLKVSDL